jgi:predicted transcriptional regulator
MRTLAIRLEDELHAQLGMIAKLEELTLTDALRQAIEQWIDERRNNPELQARAAAVLADIELEAATRKGAIEALLGNEGISEQSTSPTRRGRGTAKGDDSSTES